MPIFREVVKRGLNDIEKQQVWDYVRELRERNIYIDPLYVHKTIEKSSSVREAIERIDRLAQAMPGVVPVGRYELRPRRVIEPRRRLVVEQKKPQVRMMPEKPKGYRAPAVSKEVLSLLKKGGKVKRRITRTAPRGRRLLSIWNIPREREVTALLNVDEEKLEEVLRDAKEMLPEECKVSHYGIRFAGRRITAVEVTCPKGKMMRDFLRKYEKYFNSALVHESGSVR